MEKIPSYGAPGVDCIVMQGYKPVFRHAAGYSDREAKVPMDGKERFFLYSATKPVTCVAALQLYEQGAFLLSDPLYEYIPEYRELTVADGRGGRHAAARPVTVGSLFTMTAGFDYNMDSAAVKITRLETNGRVPTVRLARAFAQEPLCFEPGARWQYSKAHEVLGALVEVVSGRPFGRYLRDSIFGPLGMERTGFVHTPEELRTLMPQYRRDVATNAVGRIPPENEHILGTEYESGGAGLASTVDDYGRFAAALANGGVGENGARILSGATIDLMRANHLSAAQLQDFNWVQLAGYGYGLGVRTLVDPAAAGTGAPRGEFGWGGAAGAYLLADTANRLSLFYAQHMRESLEPYIHPRLRNILYACMAG